MTTRFSKDAPRQAALDYMHSQRQARFQLLTTSAETQDDLAYSPGVAEPVRAIAENPELAYDFTIKANLVAVISNGSAILV